MKNELRYLLFQTNFYLKEGENKTERSTSDIVAAMTSFIQENTFVLNMDSMVLKVSCFFLTKSNM